MASKPDGPILSTESFWDVPLKDLLTRLEVTTDGLSTDEAEQRLRTYGPNSLAKESRFAAVLDFLRFFENPLVLILLVASGVSFALGERVDALIIVTIVLLSVLMNSYQEFQARNAIKALRQKVASTATR